MRELARVIGTAGRRGARARGSRGASLRPAAPSRRGSNGPGLRLPVHLRRTVRSHCGGRRRSMPASRSPARTGAVRVAVVTLGAGRPEQTGLPAVRLSASAVSRLRPRMLRCPPTGSARQGRSALRAHQFARDRSSGRRRARHATSPWRARSFRGWAVRLLVLALRCCLRCCSRSTPSPARDAGTSGSCRRSDASSSPRPVRARRALRPRARLDGGGRRDGARRPCPRRRRSTGAAWAAIRCTVAVIVLAALLSPAHARTHVPRGEPSPAAPLAPARRDVPRCAARCVDGQPGTRRRPARAAANIWPLHGDPRGAHRAAGSGAVRAARLAPSCS